MYALFASEQAKVWKMFANRLLIFFHPHNRAGGQGGARDSCCSYKTALLWQKGAAIYSPIDSFTHFWRLFTLSKTLKHLLLDFEKCEQN